MCKSLLERVLGELERLRARAAPIIAPATLEYRPMPEGLPIPSWPDYFWRTNNCDPLALDQLRGDVDQWVTLTGRLRPSVPAPLVEEYDALVTTLQRFLKLENKLYGGGTATVSDAEAEADRATDALGALLGRCVDASDTVLVVPDASVILDELDPMKYRDAVGADQCEVVYVPQVLRELDGHRQSDRQHVRNRARDFRQRFAGWRRQGSLKQGVRVGGMTVKVVATEPGPEDFPSGLSESVKDDRIIASALRLGVERPGLRVVLLTGDTLMMTKAETHGLAVASLPD